MCVRVYVRARERKLKKRPERKVKGPRLGTNFCCENGGKKRCLGFPKICKFSSSTISIQSSSSLDVIWDGFYMNIFLSSSSSTSCRMGIKIRNDFDGSAGGLVGKIFLFMCVSKGFKRNWYSLTKWMQRNLSEELVAILTDSIQSKKYRFVENS